MKSTKNKKIFRNWTLGKCKVILLQKMLLKIKKEAIILEKSYTIHISDKRLIARIYKDLLQFNNHKTNCPFKELSESKILYKSLLIKKCQSRPKWNTNGISYTLAKLIKLIISSFGRDVEQLEPSHITNGNIKYTSPFWKSVWLHLIQLIINVP